MFQKQTLTHQAWTEAVRDQEIRVKALQVRALDSCDENAKDFVIYIVYWISYAV